MMRRYNFWVPSADLDIVAKALALYRTQLYRALYDTDDNLTASQEDALEDAYNRVCGLEDKLETYMIARLKDGRE